MCDRLREKTAEYEDLLAAACDDTSVNPDVPDGLGGTPDECMEMATAYLADGRHFRSEGDLPNALASFAYGHGWLDAGIRLGVLTDHAGEN